MKQNKDPIKEKNKSLNQTVLRLSSQACFGVFLSLSLLMAGLLYAACFHASHAQIALPSVYNPHTLLENHVRQIVSGYPIEAMVPYIALHKKVTAALLVGIAKKESNWGKHVPRSEDGADCFNYWGYRGAGSRGIAMGHGCFGSPEEAIAVISRRIDTLVNEYKFDTPEEIIVWKCGFSCDGHSNQSVKKWISDVKIYFNKVYN